jgi:hypothetical protein
MAVSRGRRDIPTARRRIARTASCHAHGPDPDGLVEGMMLKGKITFQLNPALSSGSLS